MHKTTFYQQKIFLRLALDHESEVLREKFIIQKSKNTHHYDLICETENKIYSKLCLTPKQLQICMNGENQAYYKIIVYGPDPEQLKFIYSMTLYGGAFSPFHNGHHESLLSLINLLTNKNNQFISDIFLLPSSKSNYQHKKILINNNIKKTMLENYLSNLNKKLNIKINLNSIELDQGGISYTAETLENIKKQYLSDRIDLNLFFYTSNESLSKITQWKNYQSVFDQANIIMCNRSGMNSPSHKINLTDLKLTEVNNLNNLHQLALDPNKMSGYIYSHKTNLPTCSSTEIRKKIADADNSWQKQVPEVIKEFIAEHHLY